MKRITPSQYGDIIHYLMLHKKFPGRHDGQAILHRFRGKYGCPPFDQWGNGAKDEFTSGQLPGVWSRKEFYSEGK